jgi:hypothetical protein
MDIQILGTLVAAVLAVAYAVEVGLQVWLQARFLAVIPPDTRAALPPHPRRPWLSFFASLRFQMAVLRYALATLPDDTPNAQIIRLWKRRMRASMVRESILITSMLLAAVAFLAAGWRPILPWAAAP